MKLFLKYLKLRRRMLVVLLGFVAIFAVCFALYHLPMGAVIYPAILCMMMGGIALILDFLRVKREHELLRQIQSISHAMADMLPSGNRIDSEDYRNIIDLICREHAAYCAETSRRYSDMVDYYTVWAHQIKTPIASMRLQLQNEDTALSRRLIADLGRVEQYVEMVLTFLRLESDSTDYIFREYDLDSIIRGAVKKFSSEFIGRKLRLVYEPVSAVVVTDEKWLSFVIEQVLSNALKYTSSGSITITLEGETTLRIRDTGMGIAPEDLPRIFENGFTGCNGRIDKRASGIGLYLCKRICSNLGHRITAQSEVDVGTTIDVDLSQSKPERE